MATTSSSIINAGDFIVDPRLTLPPGISGTGYSDTIDISQTEGTFLDAGTNVSGTDLVSETTTAATAPSSTVPVPDSIQIVSQIVRIAPGGGIVVDVEIDVSDVNGSQAYETRITKL